MLEAYALEAGATNALVIPIRFSTCCRASLCLP
ncbi:AAEL010225-PA, partial [Aedes aegypti]